MLAKLIVHAPTREAAIKRAGLALGHFVVEGVETNLGLLSAVIDSETFSSGNVTTRFLDEHLPELLVSVPEVSPVADAGAALPRTVDFNPWRGGAATGIRGTRRPPWNTPGPPSDLAGGLTRFARSAPGTRSGRVTAPLTGTVAKVMVSAGDRVEAGQVVVVLEAMKMEIAVEAPRGGLVTRVVCAVGDLVQAAQVLAEIGE